MVALALMPEALAFSIIAGVDPQIGLFASFTMAVTIAILGGRPAMISAATGAIALVIAPLSRQWGLPYLLATVILAGVIQLILGALGVAKLLQFVPRSVMVGFVNALAILIFTSQWPELRSGSWQVYLMVAVGIGIMAGMARLNATVPPPLVAIVMLTLITVAFHWRVPTVGDQGRLPANLPQLAVPNVPLGVHTAMVIAPYAAGMAAVGLLESLMTARIVDELTGAASNPTREAIGQGAANILTGFFGGMGGCAMLGQTMVNVKICGARTRISTLAAGSLLLALVVGLGDWVARIPMAALVAVMIMVAANTMDWNSADPRTLKSSRKRDTFVMLCTMTATITTNNLAVGVAAGSLVAVVASRWRHWGHLRRSNHCRRRAGD